MKASTVREILKVANPEARVCDGFDPAMVGLAHRFGFPAPVVAYDMRKFLLCLVEQGATPDEAFEHFSYNVLGAWVGEHTPVFLDLGADDEGDDEAAELAERDTGEAPEGVDFECPPVPRPSGD